MNQTITVTLNKNQKERLSRLALNYGLSLQEFSKKVLIELNNSFPEDSITNYKNPKALSASLRRAMQDFKTGKVLTSL